ncbi:MAG: hypothetical protein ACXAC5_02890 [Promethearchaeota archaeon]|jgi:hypothetical protein
MSKTKRQWEPCSVADSFCEAAANFAVIPRLRIKCFACGSTVCCKCSSIRKYLTYGKQRLCNDCQIEMDGDDRVVRRRLHRLAGYGK